MAVLVVIKGAQTEVGDLAGQVDAVDEDVAVGDFLCEMWLAGAYKQSQGGWRTEGPALRGLSHIPLDDVFRRQPGLFQGLDGP